MLSSVIGRKNSKKPPSCFRGCGTSRGRFSARMDPMTQATFEAASFSLSLFPYFSSGLPLSQARPLVFPSPINVVNNRHAGGAIAFVSRGSVAVHSCCSVIMTECCAVCWVLDHSDDLLFSASYAIKRNPLSGLRISLVDSGKKLRFKHPSNESIFMTPECTYHCERDYL